MSETQRYSTVAIILHWVLAALLVGMVFFGWYMEGLRENLPPNGDASPFAVQSAFNAHKTVGMAILLLSLARLAWRLTHPGPGLPDHMKAWEKTAATTTHWLFYAIMIGMPIGGWIAASATPFPSLLFNNPDLVLPKLPVPQTEEFALMTGSAHGAGGWAILVLLALHVGAALKHQFVEKDGLLARMLPLLKG